MIMHVTKARYLSARQFEVTFNDGRTGVADLSESLNGPVFEPLREPAFCARGAVDPEIGTIIWPNGADMAPEYFYDLAFRDDERLADLFREFSRMGIPSRDVGGVQRSSLMIAFSHAKTRRTRREARFLAHRLPQRS